MNNETKASLAIAKRMGWLSEKFIPDNCFLGTDYRMHTSRGCAGDGATQETTLNLVVSCTVNPCPDCWGEPFAGHKTLDIADGVLDMVFAEKQLYGQEFFSHLSPAQKLTYLGDLRENYARLSQRLAEKELLTPEVASEMQNLQNQTKAAIESVRSALDLDLYVGLWGLVHNKYDNPMDSQPGRKVWLCIYTSTQIANRVLGAADLTFEYPQRRDGKVLCRVPEKYLPYLNVHVDTVFGVDQNCTPKELEFLLNSGLESVQEFDKLLTAWRAAQL